MLHVNDALVKDVFIIAFGAFAIVEVNNLVHVGAFHSTHEK